jgi:hypothetical protein
MGVLSFLKGNARVDAQANFLSEPIPVRKIPLVDAPSTAIGGGFSGDDHLYASIILGPKISRVSLCFEPAVRRM